MKSNIRETNKKYIKESFCYLFAFMRLLFHVYTMLHLFFS